MLKKFFKAWWLLITEKDGQWHPHDISTMRRWINGAWQHREMTPREAADEFSLTQW
jgi:hypothetical protein